MTHRAKAAAANEIALSLSSLRRSSRGPRCGNLLDFAANFAGYIISEIRLTVELIEKTLRFKHTDIMKIPELDRVARFF